MNAKQVLNRYWGHEDFRPLQEDIITSVLERENTLTLMPTGGGKSICFQVPAMMMDGICIVVSPLIALMYDQVKTLKHLGIKAQAIHSGMSFKEIDICLNNCIYADYKFLYVAPERLLTELFLARVQKMNISLLAIDEAHCISQWGYDFRPAYLNIAQFKTILHIKKVVALTATATAEVKKDIVAKLEMDEVNIFQQSFARPNLSYAAIALEDKLGKIVTIAKKVGGTGIVYAASRKKTKEITSYLTAENITADFYHAGLSPIERKQKQEAWLAEQISCIVATNAFGMGIDHPHVRWVIHAEMPSSLEAYYQEAGRAGRDGKKSYGVVLFHSSDISRLEKEALQKVPPEELIKKVYQALCNYCKVAVGLHPTQPANFDITHFARTFQLPLKPTYNAIKILEAEGWIHVSDMLSLHSKLHFLIDRAASYQFQVKYPQYDVLIKTVLRLYGGEVYTHYIAIKENEMSKLSGIRQQDVEHQLQLLHKLGVLYYQRYSDKTKVCFLKPRVSMEQWALSASVAWKRQRSQEQIKGVLSYLETNQCRTQFLQAYFDEHTKKTCGICDNDLEKKKKA